MNNNDIFKKLRVALQLRDDQIVEICQLAEFRISKGEIGNIFRNADHPNYMECGDQILRNFLNGLVIHLRGTKENPKNSIEIIKQNQAAVKQNVNQKNQAEFGIKNSSKTNTDTNKKITTTAKSKFKKDKPKVQVVEKVKFNNGKKNKS